MRRIFISTLVIFLMTNGLFAQDLRLGIRGGLNLPNIMVGGESTPVSEDYKSLVAGAGGIFAEYQFNKTISLRFGVEYSGMGGKKEGMQGMPTFRLLNEMMKAPEMQGFDPGLVKMFTSQLGDYYYSDISNKVTMDYIMVPLLAQFGWNIGQSPWKVYFNVGPFASYLLAGTQKSKGESKLFTDEKGTKTLWDLIAPYESLMPSFGLTSENIEEIKKNLNENIDFGAFNNGEIDVTSEMQRFNWGIAGNVGFSYQFKRSSIFIEGGGNFGFIVVQKDIKSGSNRIGAGSVMLGYSYSLFN